MRGIVTSEGQDGKQGGVLEDKTGLAAANGKMVALICHLWQNSRMEFQELLRIVGDEPLFETGLLLAGDVNPDNVRRQLFRWTAAGKLYQLRRGLYALAPPYQKKRPHPFLVANRLARASYVSLQAALAYYGLIPEHVPVVTSVTTARPVEYETPLGHHTFRHVKRELLYGYHLVKVGDDQQAFVATPEKALLDHVYLEPEGDKPAYLRELRLQNLERLDVAALRQMAEQASNSKLKRAAASVAALAEREQEAYEVLSDRTD
jgi:predicted transcriptional regulator of viral defense system